jgi:hypothetical protein
MEVKPVASPDARIVTPQAIRQINTHELAPYSPLYPVTPQVHETLKELGKMAGFFIMPADSKLLQGTGQIARDIIYSTKGEKIIDDFPQGEIVDISQAHLASMTSLAIGKDEREQIAQGRIIRDWERPSLNTSLADANVKKTIIAFDKRDRETHLDLYIAKTADNNVEVSLFQASTAIAPNIFPYQSAPLRVEQFGFDPKEGIRTGYYPYQLPMVLPPYNQVYDKKIMRRTLIAVAAFILLILIYGRYAYI